jgi:hypothetical protein
MKRSSLSFGRVKLDFEVCSLLPQSPWRNFSPDRLLRTASSRVIFNHETNAGQTRTEEKTTTTKHSGTSSPNRNAFSSSTAGHDDGDKSSPGVAEDSLIRSQIVNNIVRTLKTEQLVVKSLLVNNFYNSSLGSQLEVGKEKTLVKKSS